MIESGDAMPQEGDILTIRGPIFRELLAEASYHDGAWHVYTYGPGRDGVYLGEFPDAAAIEAALDAKLAEDRAYREETLR